MEKDEMRVKCSTKMGDVRSEYAILVEKPGGKGQLGIPKHGWEDNIKYLLQKYSVTMWTGFIWFSARSSSGIL
jgi:hypothetical protein